MKMSLTRSNIAYDLKISPHYHLVEYSDTSIRYTFSSDLYRRNFISKLASNRENINNSLSKRFGFNIIADKIADLRLYTSIEKRGFLISIDGKNAEWPESITLDGSQMIIKS